MTFLCVCLAVIFICQGIRQYEDKKLMLTNPEAWRAKKAHEEEKKARKLGMAGRAGFELFKWWLK